MKRIAAIVVSALGLALGGCSGADGSGGAGGSGPQCTVSSQCPLGEKCEGSVCVEDTACTPESCTGNQFCDSETQQCTDPVTKCDTNTCACYIVDSTGNIRPQGETPTFVMVAGASRNVEVVVAVEGGLVVPGAAYSLSASNANFTTSGTTLTAAASAANDGEAVLTASVTGLINPVTCTANLVNKGPAPSVGARFYVFNDLTGAPVENARIIVDLNGDGVVNGDDISGDTGEDGFFVADEDVFDGPYNVSVFAYDENGAGVEDDVSYNYVTLVGITSTDVVIPVSARPVTQVVGGYTGRVDYSLFEDRYLNGKGRELKAAIASNSIPLQALLNFDLSLLVGEMPEEECPEAPAPLPPGCYSIALGGPEIRTPLPGGVQLQVSSVPVKNHVDAVGVPGVRTAWALAGEVGISDVSTLLFDPDIQALLNCKGAACDNLQVPIGKIFEGALPLLANFGSGVRSNLNLPARPQTEWNNHLSKVYAQRDPNPNFPKLDGNNPSDRLEIPEALSRFLQINAPNLPDDGTGQTTEALVMLTGFDGPGGIVPLGLTAGLDCTKGNCLDRSGGAGAGEFDGVVNGGRICKYSSTPNQNFCPPTVPSSLQGVLPKGQMGMFYAPPHSGLDPNKLLTIFAALPLSQLAGGDASELRVTAFVVRGNPKDIGTSAGVTPTTSMFPPVPDLDALSEGGEYTLPAVTGADLHWLTIASDVDPETGLSTRWNVYAAAGATINLPDPKAVWDADRVDPTEPNSATEGTVAQHHINVTHIAYDLNSGAPSLDAFVTNDGSTLIDLLDHVRGLSIVSGDVCANSDEC